MFDAQIRPLIDPPLNAAGRRLARAGVSANAVTVGGFCVGLLACPAILGGQFVLAALLIAVSRLADGLDGAIARATQKSDLGGFLDITLDFIFYGAVPLMFAILDPPANALAAAVLLMAFFANGTTFLAYAIMAERRKQETTAQGIKSIYYLARLAEGFETIAFLILICLVPDWFSVLAYTYAGLCFLSAGSRLAMAATTLRDPQPPTLASDRNPDEARAGNEAAHAHSNQVTD